jgi:hypothetical protein
MATCPICGDYEGSSQQVQAHISAKQDGSHKGKTGREYAAQIEGGGNGETIQLGGPESGESIRTGNGRNGNIQSGQKKGQQGRQASQNGQPRPGPETRGTSQDVPQIACEKCERKVAYPELMPYKMTCPGCGRKLELRDAAEAMEKKADEKGKDETVETLEV